VLVGIIKDKIKWSPYGLTNYDMVDSYDDIADAILSRISLDEEKVLDIIAGVKKNWDGDQDIKGMSKAIAERKPFIIVEEGNCER